ncbi:MAG: hypothetical protein AAFW83_05140, partial [Pseudomonadota bacterium]
MVGSNPKWGACFNWFAACGNSSRVGASLAREYEFLFDDYPVSPGEDPATVSRLIDGFIFHHGIEDDKEFSGDGDDGNFFNA